MKPHTSIVVPCFNEGHRLPVDAFLSYLDENRWLHLVLVDDGSTDHTPTLLTKMVEREPDRCHMLQLPSNQGKGEAVRRGLLSALDTDAEVVGYWDADLATPLKDIADFVDRLVAQPQLEIIIGARVKLLGRRIDRRLVRHYAGRVAAAAAAMVLDIGVYDTQCGAKIFRVNTGLREVFQQPFMDRWVFDVEILARWIRLHPDRTNTELEQFIYEVPLDQWSDVPDSRLRTSDLLRAPIQLARIALRYRK